jgi:integrase
MRRSEIAGLKWDSVDLTGGRVAVVETLQRIRGKGLMIGQPKTNKSRRSIALSPVAVGLLRRVQGSQLLARANAGDAWEQTNYVFTQADGRSLNPDKLTTEFHRLVKTSGLPVLTFHGLRHAHATLLLSAGVHAKVVSERLGHSNVGITLDVYSHVLPNIQEDAARAIDAQLQNP